MDKITPADMSQGYALGAIGVNSDMLEWIGALDAGVTLMEWESMPMSESAALMAAAGEKHLPRSADAAAHIREGEGGGKIAVLSDGAEIPMRTPLTRDRMRIAAADPVEKNCRMIARLIPLSFEEVYDLPVDDYVILFEAMESFR